MRFCSAADSGAEPSAPPALSSFAIWTMKLLGELLQQWMIRVRCDPFDHELTPRDADRQRRAIDEQAPDFSGDGVHRSLEQRMPRRIDRVLVHRDGELDQKVGELPRQHRRAAAIWRALRRRSG